MTSVTGPLLDAHYQRSFGALAGYLPEDRSGLAAWHAVIREKAAQLRNDQGPGYANQAVQDLANLIDTNGIVRMYVTEAIDQTSAFTKNIKNIQDMLEQLDFICTTTPEYNVNKKVRVLFPMSALFVDMMATPAGKALFRLEPFNEALRAILQTWAAYLDSQASCSVFNRDPSIGWLGTAAIAEFKLADFVIDWDAGKTVAFSPTTTSFIAKFRPVVGPSQEKVMQTSSPRPTMARCIASQPMCNKAPCSGSRSRATRCKTCSPIRTPRCCSALWEAR